MGVYRAAFTTMEQTAELTSNKVTVPIVGLGGAMAQGKRVHNMLRLVAESVTGGSVADSGHFLPEENPAEVVRQILQLIDTTTPC